MAGERGGITFTWPGRGAAEDHLDAAPHSAARAAWPTDIATEENLLIEGDNLDALALLEPTHADRVKVVYIDPPYNTGSALPYRDTFGAAGHAGWLSMMLPRLVLARRLMRGDGVLFASIDDREHAHLALLGQEVFGEENFLGSFVHQRAKGGGSARTFVRGHDYILVWAKDAARVAPFVTEKRKPTRYEVIDGVRCLVDDDVLRVTFGKYAAGSERRLMYEDVEAVRGPAKKAQVDAWLAAGTHVLRPWAGGKHAVAKVTPADRAHSKMYSIIRALGDEGRRDLEDLGLGGLFGYPKPVSLLRELVRSQTFFDPEALVLDFFAGSGTTAQAVAQLNAADGGRRRFILVQRAEELRRVDGARSDRAAHGEPITTISGLMRERVRRAGARFRDVRLPEPPAQSPPLH
ncbi:site-specific DNA-methyltransferase [Brevibacterium sp. 5221]|uniref:Site-specific DNA-methyltransferase n=1 Tax=Brevibacterium rongguiense TaxID=2695267 RepID=A0A6N9H4V8_9MICO|nr:MULTISPECIES: site-specific DNA-methyltransferase [Brevibacterium]MYM18871.1 site-specific DNA-methyltransferase [Brevibacterium rongguiense]WAL39386.1 site-specific DNA-methyltransferase [Brevibacterium sp. BRM-1]